MQRHQTGFTELGAEDRQQIIFQIDVISFEPQRLTNPQAGYR
jgi:hypothetical protein